MPHLWKIDQLLADRDRPEFLRLISSPGTSIRIARLWLAERGHSVCHSAVGGYTKRWRERSLFSLRLAAGITDDADARTRLAELAGGLTGNDLTSLVLFAAYLHNIKAATAGVPAGGVAGLVPMTPASTAGAND
jgi:hypothetical protein